MDKPLQQNENVMSTVTNYVAQLKEREEGIQTLIGRKREIVNELKNIQSKS